MNLNIAPNTVTWRSMCIWRKLTWTLTSPQPTLSKMSVFKNVHDYWHGFPRAGKYMHQGDRRDNIPFPSISPSKMSQNGPANFAPGSKTRNWTHIQSPHLLQHFMSQPSITCSCCCLNRGIASAQSHLHTVALNLLFWQSFGKKISKNDSITNHQNECTRCNPAQFAGFQWSDLHSQFHSQTVSKYFGCTIYIQEI